MTRTDYKSAAFVPASPSRTDQIARKELIRLAIEIYLWIYELLPIVAGCGDGRVAALKW